MYSMEKLKELAVRQMRAAADLYEVCEKAERDLKKDDEYYNKLYLRVQRNYRYELLKHLLDLKPAMEERDLWDEIMEGLN